jgi:hypothetical protein
VSESNILDYLVAEIRKVSEGIMKKIQLTEEAIIERKIHTALKDEIRTTVPEMNNMPEEELDRHVDELISTFEGYVTGKSLAEEYENNESLDFFGGKINTKYSQNEKNIASF